MSPKHINDDISGCFSSFIQKGYKLRCEDEDQIDSDNDVSDDQAFAARFVDSSQQLNGGDA